MTEYDILGRVKRQSVPTEVDANFDPTGDDQTRGWLWTHQRYDWMGRVVRRIATDGDPNAPENDSDVLISYAGCGCAGGLETTIQGELVPRTDGTSGNARRKQKVYQDILGRTFKTETYNWNGTVYSTSLASFNERDQVLRSRQYEGGTSSTTFQDTTTEYDGHGRAWRTHSPEQRDSSNNPVYTVTTFNLDDSINSITDGRGSTATYTYDIPLGLVSQINYSVPQGSNIPVTPTVSFQFDVLGNRTQMNDGSGTTVYTYDELSRITAETKTFSGRSGDFTLSYQYTLSGDVKRIDLPNGTAVLYSFDKLGRVRALNGTGFQDDRYSYNIDNLMPDIQYRAWGGIKSMEHGSSAQTTVAYDNRLKTAEFRVPGMMEIDYEYSADGRVKFQEDLLNPSFDRSYEYDHQNRLVKAKSGAEASGGTSFTGPYRQNYEYNAFNNMTLRDTWFWSESVAYGFSASYANNRRSNWQHDFDGNVTADHLDQMKFKFDADGANSLIEYPVKEEGNMRYETKKHLIADGDGDVVIQKDELRGYLLHGTLRHSVDENSYSLKATPLGGLLLFKQ